MKKIKTWDQVIVISWKHKWKVAKVFNTKDITSRKWHINSFVYLEGVNVAKKAVKWQWFKDIVLPIHISNIAYWSEQDKKSSKIWFSIKDWKKRRFLKKLDRELDS